ncbi:unnamed protein product [Ectocarpus sp. 12 AP-2014]
MRSVDSETLFGSARRRCINYEKSRFEDLEMSPPSKTPTAVAPGLVALHDTSKYMSIFRRSRPPHVRVREIDDRKWYSPLPYNPGTAQALARGESLEIKQRTSAVGQKKNASVPRNILFSTVHNDEYRGASCGINPYERQELQTTQVFLFRVLCLLSYLYNPLPLPTHVATKYKR